MSSLGDSTDPNVHLTIVNRPPYRPATSVDPISAYSLLRRTGDTSSQLTAEYLDELRETQFYDFLRDKGYVKADGNTYAVIQTVWGEDVVSFVYTGLVHEGDTTREVNDAPPQAHLEGFLNGLHGRSSGSNDNTAQIFVPYYPRAVKQRMIWSCTKSDGRKETRYIAMSKWAIVLLAHGRESCSPFCPAPDATIQTSKVPDDSHLCTARDLSRAAWLWYMENDVMEEQRGGSVGG